MEAAITGIRNRSALIGRLIGIGSLFPSRELISQIGIESRKTNRMNFKGDLLVDVTMSIF